ncbi:MAG: nucleotidyltransferase substrate binding protein [Gammaproteobacteria bacterium]|nr:nucleotidyltransferase substrate binding protein [Gammaproteobacteria bacterium]
MNELKTIRWQQRFENFEKAFKQLQEAVNRADELDRLGKEGLIQRFEYTFELSWKTLKDYLEAQGLQATSPRQTLKVAFQYNLIDDGELWLIMLDKRNLMAHTYNEDYFIAVFSAIIDSYFIEIEKLYNVLKNE